MSSCRSQPPVAVPGRQAQARLPVVGVCSGLVLRGLGQHVSCLSFFICRMVTVALPHGLEDRRNELTHTAPAVSTCPSLQQL